MTLRLLAWACFCLVAGQATAQEAFELDLAGLKAAQGYEIVRSDGFATLRALPGAASEGIPVTFELPTVLEEKFGGREIVVEITARAHAGGEARYAAAYYTLGVGNSGPMAFAAGTDFAVARFSYLVPEPKGEPGKDVFGLFPTDPVDIRAILITVD